MHFLLEDMCLVENFLSDSLLSREVLNLPGDFIFRFLSIF